MESKLEEYRLRKRRQQRFEEFKDVLRKMLTFGSGARTGDEPTEHVIDVKPELENIPEDKPLLSDVVSSSDDEVDAVRSVQEESAVQDDNKYLKYTLRGIYFLFWVTCYMIAIELQFGIVFLMFSALLGIYFNTRTRPKQKGEVSAYSVFNKDFESIDGTLKAEQFEREIRYGSTSVK